MRTILLATAAAAMAPTKIESSSCGAPFPVWTVDAPATTDPRTPTFDFSITSSADWVPPTDGATWRASGSLGLPGHPLGIFKINATGDACDAQEYFVYDGVLGRVNLTFPGCPWPETGKSTTIQGTVTVYTPIPAVPPIVSTGFRLGLELLDKKGDQLMCVDFDVVQPPTSGADPKQDRCGLNDTPDLPSYPPPEGAKLPTGVVDLNDPPATRWDAVIKPRKNQVKALVESVIDHLGKSTHHNKTLITLLLDRGVVKELERFPPDYAEEIRGVARAAEVPVWYIFVINICYELIGLCTSLVAQSDDGQIWHARNLDLGIFLGTDAENHTWSLTHPLRDALVDVTFVKGDETIFTSTTYAGFVGVHSGMKASKFEEPFALTMNSRFDDSLDAGLISFLLGGAAGRMVTAFQTRRILEVNETYAAALDSLKAYRSLGPAYIILSGAAPAHGAVVTKGFWVHDRKPPTIDVSTLSDAVKNGSYYVVQTNYDRDGPPPAFDDRRYPIVDCLDGQTPSDVTKPKLFAVMSANPTRNALTTFTMLMSPTTGEYETYKQECKPSVHCSPF